MLANPKLRLFTLVCSSALMLSLDATSRSIAAGQCVDFSKDPAGCQPSTFDTPIGDMPSTRIGRTGNLDPKSSEADARAGAALLEKNLHLFRNTEHLHWVITVFSVKDEATGNWKDGDLDAAGDGRGLAGNCVFGHQNGAGKRHAINIREHRRDAAEGEVPGRLQPAGSRWSAD